MSIRNSLDLHVDNKYSLKIINSFHARHIAKPLPARRQMFATRAVFGRYLFGKSTGMIGCGVWSLTDRDSVCPASTQQTCTSLADAATNRRQLQKQSRAEAHISSDFSPQSRKYRRLYTAQGVTCVRHTGRILLILIGDIQHRAGSNHHRQ